VVKPIAFALSPRTSGVASTCVREHSRSLIFEPFHSKILSHITGGLPCPARCRLAAQEIAVSPAGRIYPCAEMIGEDDREHLVVGHVDTGIDAERVLELRRSKERVYGACGACALKSRCQHRCGCRQLAVSGELGKLSARFCEIEALFIEQADRVAETLWGESCPAFRALYYDRAWRPEPGAE
jgi:radical SAM protein with 4Fe4S-binding SPASM domain